MDKYPSYNGKDVIIGILDTGVDPGAIGLSNLPPSSDGTGKGSSAERKLIHVADCTGSGDISMNVSTVAVKGKDGWVIEKNIFGDGKVILNKDLELKPFPLSDQDEENNEDDSKDKKDKEDKSADADSAKDGKKDDKDAIKMPVRLGYKRLYELFPNKLTNRVKNHYKKEFETKNNIHAVELHHQLAAFNGKYKAGELTQDQLREKEDIVAKLDLLEGKSKLGDTDPLKEDLGPLCQVILFYDGEDYRVLVDVTGSDSGTDSDLSSVPVKDAMTDFYKEGQYKTFGHVDMCNYAVNIYQGGKVVSVVVDAGAHGSHVAGITARYHNEQKDSDNDSDVIDEEPNGVAPGAKLISLKIGDSRLGGMETGCALTRAMIEAVKHKCDVINLSYGEGCAFPDTGRFVKLAEELVHKHGIVFVSSAGNNGPALTTVGAPGGTSTEIIGVAAYVSPSMMKAEYCAPKDDNEGTTYTWSSVGPTADGAQGVDIMAPGAAITCVPNWCLQRNQLMNGTSMSSPNAAGCIALLLSAAKAEGIKVTPARLRRALMNCAEKKEGLSNLQQGAGMINVDKTWDYLKKFKDDPFGDINFKVRIIGRPGHRRGVYIRQPEETLVKQTFSADINPVFGTEDDADAHLQQKRIEFEMKTALEASAPWIEVPEFFMLMHNGRSFKFTVDPTKLEPGVHTANIMGYDVNKKDAGPRFSVPVTVVKTLDKSPSISLGSLEFESNEVKRFFLDVPENASWMDVTVKDSREPSKDENSARLMVLHTIQLLPQNAYRDAQVQKYLNLLPSQEIVTSIPVHPGITCELDLARYWSAQGSTNMKVGIEFRGVSASPDDLTMVSGGDGVRTRLYSALSNQYIKPAAKLTKWKTPLIPTKSSISPCDERDILPARNTQIHQLVLTYEFEQKEKGSFVARAPALQGYIYESAFESQIILAFDEDKNYLGVFDSWPDEVSAPKGKVTMRMQVRHDDIKKLELLKDTSIWIERKLSSAIALSPYSSHSAMVSDGPTMKRQTLRKGTSTAVFFKDPPSSKLPSECKSGDILTGSATFEDDANSSPGIGHNPDGTKIKYVVGAKVKSNDKEEKAKTPEVPDKRTVDEKVEEEIRSIKVAQLKKIMDKDENSEEIEEFYKKLLSEYPDHIPLLMTALKYYDSKDKRSDRLEKVIDTADLIISKTDEKEIAAHFGMKHDEEDAESAKERKDMTEKKSFLIEALARKAHAHVGDEDKFNDTLKVLSKWEDIEKNKKYAVLSMEKYKTAKRFGLILKLLNSLLEKNGDDTKDGIYPMKKDEIIKERSKVLKSLNYTELAERDDSWTRASSALKDFALF